MRADVSVRVGSGVVAVEVEQPVVLVLVIVTASVQHNTRSVIVAIVAPETRNAPTTGIETPIIYNFIYFIYGGVTLPQTPTRLLRSRGLFEETRADDSVRVGSGVVAAEEEQPAVLDLVIVTASVQHNTRSVIVAIVAYIRAFTSCNLRWINERRIFPCSDEERRDIVACCRSCPYLGSV